MYILGALRKHNANFGKGMPDGLAIGVATDVPDALREASMVPLGTARGTLPISG